MKENKDFRKLLILSHTVVKKSHKRSIMLGLTLILGIGGLIPGIIYGSKAISNYFNNQSIRFSGDYLPTDLCKKAPFNQLEWCQIISEPIVVDYKNVTIRDTRNEAELYTVHNFNGVAYARYDADPTKQDGEILSSNLRYEYAYNTIVKSIIKFAPEVNPDATSLSITGINILTTNNLTGAPISYSFTDNNQLEALARVAVYDNKSRSSSTFNVPVVIFNNSNFYNRFFNFMNSYHQLDIKSGGASAAQNQSSAVIMGANGRNWIVPSSLWQASASNDLAVNQWLYKYMLQNLNYLYFNNWQEFAVARNDLSLNDNPLRNFVIYAPSINPLGFPDEAMYHNDETSVLRGLSSIVINPDRRDNILPLSPGLRITKQSLAILSKTRFYNYILFLPPQYSLDYYWNAFGGNILEVYNQLNNLINFNGNTAELVKLVEKYPFVKDLSFAPFQQTLYEEAFDHKISKQHWYLSHAVDDSTAPLDISLPQDRATFLYRYWSAVNLYAANYNPGSGIEFLQNPLSNPDIQLDSINISYQQMVSVAAGNTVDVEGVNVSTVNAYLDTLVRYKMYELMQSVNRNFPGEFLTNLPPNFNAFNTLVSAGDIQLQQIGGTIWEQFRSKNNGITEDDSGYFTPNQILATSPSDRNSITSFQAFYNIGGVAPRNSLTNLHEPLVPYRLNYYRQLYTFHINPQNWSN